MSIALCFSASKKLLFTNRIVPATAFLAIPSPCFSFCLAWPARDAVATSSSSSVPLWWAAASSLLLSDRFRESLCIAPEPTYWYAILSPWRKYILSRAFLANGYTASDAFGSFSSSANCIFICIFATQNIATLVLSRQSIQLTRTTPFCTNSDEVEDEVEDEVDGGDDGGGDGDSKNTPAFSVWWRTNFVRSLCRSAWCFLW
mmetsp:Transcript_22502/g.44600  ORF Transcript_22502/g.44600 Transcript_22502/m.44600 type:complete len:202 (-) Transcript_22502:117-722(-)